jgi:hypothetical protein
MAFPLGGRGGIYAALHNGHFRPLQGGVKGFGEKNIALQHMTGRAKEDFKIKRLEARRGARGRKCRLP